MWVKSGFTVKGRIEAEVPPAHLGALLLAGVLAAGSLLTACSAGRPGATSRPTVCCAPFSPTSVPSTTTGALIYTPPFGPTTLPPTTTGPPNYREQYLAAMGTLRPALANIDPKSNPGQLASLAEKLDNAQTELAQDIWPPAASTPVQDLANDLGRLAGELEADDSQAVGATDRATLAAATRVESALGVSPTGGGN
jgi:hypothetical protein